MQKVLDLQNRRRLILSVLTASLPVTLLLFSNVPRVQAVPSSIITVNTLLDNIANDGLCSLREAIQSANAGMPIGNCASGAPGPDTINISVTGTIVLTSTLPEITTDVNIFGPGASLLTISGNNAVPIFKINSGAKATLSDVTVANGFTNTLGGGGIYNAGTLTVTNAVIYNNNAASGDGGGIYNYTGGVTIIGSSIYSNTSTSTGGGLYSILGSVTIVGSNIYSNSATNSGGGLTLDYSTSNITNSNIYTNSAGLGGGVLIHNATFNAANSSIYDNSALSGGGIRADLVSTVTISSSSIYNNRATQFSGGGFYSSMSGGPPIVFANSTFFSNSAQFSGGAIFLSYNLSLTNSTLALNKASSGGGGIYVNTGTATLKNTIVANSVASANCVGSIADGGTNLQFGGTGVNSCGVSILTGDPKLAPFGNYGGATKTMPLYLGSAALDAGDDIVCAAPPISNLDQRGQIRPIGAHCDIGAFEGLWSLYLPLIRK